MLANYEQILIDKFYEIKSRGWIPTNRYGDQCLGNTFEDLIGKMEDNNPYADFHGIEFKSHRIVTQSLVTLFSKAPSYPRRANTFLRNNYGIDEENYGYPILNTTVSGQKENTHRAGFGYRAFVDWNNQCVRLIIRNLITGEIEKNDIYWSFSVISTAIQNKINTIAILYGDERINNGQREVLYTQMDLIRGITLEKMLHAIEDGNLLIDIRIGVYASGKNIGKQHDHGTAFRMPLQSLLNIYGERQTFK